MSTWGSHSKVRILLVDDDPSDRALVVDELKEAFAELQVDLASDAPALERALANADYSLIITDSSLLWTKGLTVVDEIRSRHPSIPIIMFTGIGNEEVAVEAMKSGVEDYVLKAPGRFSRLNLSVRQALTRRRERETIIRIEKAIREIERRFLTFIENFNGILFQMDLDFHPLYLQGRVLEITGYSTGELLSTRAGWVELLHPGCRDKYLESCKKIRTIPGFSCEREYRLVRKDGQVKWVREVLQNVCSQEKVPESVQGLLYDIDERKTMEESLRRSECLVLLGRMVSVVAHELNNPLANIAVCAGALRSRLGGPGSVDPEHRSLFESYLGTVVSESMRCKGIIGDLLGMVRSGDRKIESVDVVDLVRATVHLLNLNKDRYGHVIDVRAEETLGRVQTDPDRLRQILAILLNNALEAMPSGTGTVSVACTLAGDGRFVEISVSDEGPGVPEHLREKIFEPFFTTKQDTKGTGLGLAVAEGIVSGLGGQIGLRPSEVEGATFYIRLPREFPVPEDETMMRGAGK